MDNTVHSSRAGAGCVGVTFPSSAEHIAIQALTQLAKPGGGSVDSILEKALQLTSTGRNTVPDIGQPTALTQQEKPIPSAGPVDSILEKALQLTSTGRNTFSEIDHDTSPNISIRVRAANESVAALNAGPLTKPNAFDREFWIRSKELAFSTQYLTAANLTVMSTWRHTTWTHGDDREFLLPAAVIQMSSPAPSSPLSDISSEHDTAPEILDLVKASDLAQAELDKFRSTSHRAGSRSEQRLIEAVEGAKEALDQAQKGLQDAPSSVTEAGEPVQNSLDHAPKTGPTSLTTGPASASSVNSPGIDPALVSMEPQFNNKARKPSYSGFGTTPGFQYRQDSLFGLPPYLMASWTQWNQAGNSEQGQGSEQMYGSLLSGGAANGEQGQGSEQMYGSLLSGGAANSEQGQGNQQVHETLLAGGAANSEQGQGGQQMHGILPSGGAANSEQDAQPAHGIQAGFWGYGGQQVHGILPSGGAANGEQGQGDQQTLLAGGAANSKQGQGGQQAYGTLPSGGAANGEQGQGGQQMHGILPSGGAANGEQGQGGQQMHGILPSGGAANGEQGQGGQQMHGILPSGGAANGESESFTANKAKAASKCTEFFPREALQTANKAKAASRCTEFCPWEGLQTANKAKAASKCMGFFPREGLQMANKTKYAAQVAALVAVKLESSALLSIETKGTQQKKPKTVKAPKREDSGNNSPGEEFDFEKAEEGDDDDDEGGMKIPGRHQRGARGNGLRAARGGKIGDLVKNWITLSPEQRREKSMAAQQALLESWEVQQQTGTCKGFTQAVGPYIRDIQELCPDAGSTSFQIFREIHKTSTGNYQCGHHHGHHGPKQILADGNLKNKWTIVGQPRPYQLKKTKDDVVAVMPGYFHCGCDEKEVAIDFFIWKMRFEITRDVERKDETISVTEAMGSQRLDPRTRAFFCDLLAKQGITFDTIYTNGASRADWKMTMLAKQVEVVASRLDKATLAAGHIDPTEPGQSLVVVPMAALLPEDTTNQGKGKGKDMARKGGMNH
ncbi:hypothetical protein FB451DRAFT_1490330 [Mycena latifolia]|nr:hypothetical protein FB451DRAFT_1490330 [Mycena latifolia]